MCTGLVTVAPFFGSMKNTRGRVPFWALVCALNAGTTAIASAAAAAADR
jgi:hypothetical protein